jgi:hypothetical protein
MVGLEDEAGRVDQSAVEVEEDGAESHALKIAARRRDRRTVARPLVPIGCERCGRESGRVAK